MDRLRLQLMPSSGVGKKARPLSLSTTTRPWPAQDWEKREACFRGKGRTRGEGRGMGGEEGGSASELHSTPSILSPSYPVPQYEGGEIEEAEAIAWERRREDTSVGMEEHSS